MSDEALPAATRYACCDTLRRNAVAAHPTLNGIDFLEVLDADAPPGVPRQRTLMLHWLKAAPPLGMDNLALSGGERVRNVRIEWVAVAAAPPGWLGAAERGFYMALPDAGRILLVRTDSNGDFSPYTLRVRRSPADARAPQGVDPCLANVAFSFKVECPSEFDCKATRHCGDVAAPPPEIDYLAKDYASFRRLLQDRIAQLLPDWQSRTPADLGATLVELLAYAGDHLSYWQDAVATEAYLDTARRRTSLRRHALLVDYPLHEGSNARLWVQLVLAAGVAEAEVALAGMRFLTRVADVPERVPDDPALRAWRDAHAAHPTVFEPMDPAGSPVLAAGATMVVRAAHHALYFHTWGERRCCLPRGAVSATLRGHLDTLHAGDVLVFEEAKGPATGAAGDADPAHRHAVRLVAVHTMQDGAPLTDPLDDTPITAIAWHAEDALPFPLCISAVTDDAHGARYLDDVSVARGNILLADHGATVAAEPLGAVPPPNPRLRLAEDGQRDGRDRCDPAPPEPVPVRYRPTLAQRPLTHAATVHKTVAQAGRVTRRRMAFDPAAAAAHAFAWRQADVLPVVALEGTAPGGTPREWEARRDLLGSADDARHFVVESEADGTATLRFGDDRHGSRPESGTVFVARYRVGQGPAGNIGADALGHVVTNDARLGGVRNPLAAAGGTPPESAQQIRRRAPEAFRSQERAVTPRDYAAVAGRWPGVQRAAATQRWTGSWHTMFVTVDRSGGAPLDAALRADLAAFIEPYRMAGHDLEFDDPVHVPLVLHMTVCVAADHFRSHVRAELLRVLSGRDLPDGRRGLFHPDLLTFGQGIYLSPIVAAARAVPGVDSVEITRFARQDSQDQPGADAALATGVLPIGRLEIARLDNDGNFPERGQLALTLFGGK